jgi:hypothetical protein
MIGVHAVRAGAPARGALQRFHLEALSLLQVDEERRPR